MVKFFLSIFLLLSLSVHSQKTEGLITNYPEVVLPAILEFNDDANRNGFNSKYFLDKDLRGILILPKSELNNYCESDNPYRAASICTVYNPQKKRYEVIIVFSEIVLKHPSIFKMLLYHELFHFFGLEHETLGLMSGDPIRIQDFTIQEIDSNFKKVKTIPPKNYFKTILK
ncbi:hypothetical protein JM79_3222 [Gramella sp. Hel_I_59]|uniref:hypothetical protein n=1 Tax=Gramella sp. Hel_I_59 TaxID=1249978 RepID=UPI00114FC279|nr:hypothetical protein [Gramella sp. Hel_I_59]TQI72265.1 hypothetical protein JM79_3222 [Gramella sp. Hel_I_59]